MYTGSKRHTTASLIALTAMLGGCAGFHQHQASNDQPPVEMTQQESGPVQFGAGASPNETGNSSGTTLVGLFGETEGHENAASGFGDGAGNISQLTFATEGENFDPDISSDGKWIVFSSTQHRTKSDIYVKPVGGSTLTQLTNDPANDMMPEFSPDGKWIAFSSDRSGSWDIYIMPRTGGQARVITSDSAYETHPSWSPNSKQLVYCKLGSQSQRWELWVVDVDNSSTPRFVDYGFLPEWSPDPALNKILFQRARARGSRYHSIWTIDLVDDQGRNPTEILSASNAAVINPSWSPDARHIVFATVVDPGAITGGTPDECDLWVVNIDGTGRMNLTNGAAANFQPTWGPDGHVFFVSDRSGAGNLWSVVTGRTMSPASDDNSPAIANVPTNED